MPRKRADAPAIWRMLSSRNDREFHPRARARPAVRGEYDVVVLGGGPAGIAAAASAAALGRRTLMVERYGFLGAWAPPPASPRFAGCTPTSTANTARWCMALPRAPRTGSTGSAV